MKTHKRIFVHDYTATVKPASTVMVELLRRHAQEVATLAAKERRADQ